MEVEVRSNNTAMEEEANTLGPQLQTPLFPLPDKRTMEVGETTICRHLELNLVTVPFSRISQNGGCQCLEVGQ